MLNIKIETKNAAFEDYAVNELVRILSHDVINKLIVGQTEGVLHDINGNPVGQFKLTKR
jgi:hypothetical protein